VLRNPLSVFNSENSVVSNGNKTRRAFIESAVSGIMLVRGMDLIPFQPNYYQGNIKAVVFDGFAIFDPRPVFALTEKIFPGKGKEIAETWRVKQFEYTWLREAAYQYKNFQEVTEDALLFAAGKAQVILTGPDKEKLINSYLSLEIWPDVLPVLEFLRRSGTRLGFLSNMTDNMLSSCIHHNRLDEFFEKVLSTDQLKTYKPSRRAYQMATDAFQLTKSEILFVAFAGWDAAGAKWFGYPTYWVNRMEAPAEELDVSIDITEKTLNAVKNLVQNS
jgi:2-haloacid dehalogenase